MIYALIYQTIELKIFLYAKKPFYQILVHEKRLIRKKINALIEKH